MPTIVQSVERAFAVLETFDDQNPSRTAADIADTAGLSRPTTYRMLQTLQQLGYVRNIGGRFQVTPSVLRLGDGYLGSLGAGGRAYPVLNDVAIRLRLRVGLGVLDGDDVVHLSIAGCPSWQPETSHIQVGQRIPAASAAIGRLLLALQPGSDAPGADRVRRQGYEAGPSQIVTGVVTLAVPVLRRCTGSPLGVGIAIPVDDPARPVDEVVARYLPELRATADRLAVLEV